MELSTSERYLQAWLRSSSYVSKCLETGPKHEETKSEERRLSEYFRSSIRHNFFLFVLVLQAGSFSANLHGHSFDGMENLSRPTSR
jgi:hypothetical protein